MVCLVLTNDFLKFGCISSRVPLRIIKYQQWHRLCCTSQPPNSSKKPRISKTPPWRVLFFGTDNFALESLKQLHREYRSKGLLSRLEAVTAYRGEENATIKYARDHGIRVHYWPLETPLVDFDVGLVVSFGHLIPAWVIQSFPLGMINVHASLLPRWRGAAPIIYALMNGDTKTGISIMKIAPKKFDVGAILAQREIEIGPDETQPELFQRLGSIGGDLLIETVRKFPDIISNGRPQPAENITYAPKVTKDSAVVKWDEMTAKQIYNLQRALTGVFPLTTMFQRKSVKIFGVKLSPSPADVTNVSNLSPGTIFYDKNRNLLTVLCKNCSWVSVEEVVIAGRKKMTARDFNNGFLQINENRNTFFGISEEVQADKAHCKRS